MFILVGRRIIVLSHLIFSLLFSSLGQTLYAQNQTSNTNATMLLDLNAPNGTQEGPINVLNNITNSSHKLTVISSFFPIDEFVEKVGGNIVESSLVIPAGIEPHDFEPTIGQVQNINSADALVY
ncbi:MAG: zinc ABC transporter substrate-binding protein, partial [Nitrososphaeraceae archaeon]